MARALKDGYCAACNADVERIGIDYQHDYERRVGVGVRGLPSAGGPLVRPRVGRGRARAAVRRSAHAVGTS